MPISESERINLERSKEYLLKLLKGSSSDLDRKSLLDELQRVTAKLEVVEAVHSVAPPVVTTLLCEEVEAKESEPVDEQQLLYDFIYFAEQFEIKYRPGLNPDEPNKTRGRMRLTPSQKMLVNFLIRKAFVEKVPVRIIILKSRQLGCTTVLELFKLWLTVTRPNFSSFFIIDGDKHLITKREVMLDWLDQLKVFGPRLARINSGGKKNKAFFFTNKSVMMMDSALSPNPATSENISWLHTSEEPKWPANRAESIKASVVPTIAEVPGTFVIRESTAEGVGQFYQDWTVAVKGGEYTPIFIPWYLSPECNAQPPKGFTADVDITDYADSEQGGEVEISEKEYQVKYKLSDSQIYWRRKKIGGFGGNRAMFDQEYPTTPDHAFRLFQSGFFARETLESVGQSVSPPLFVGDIDDTHYKGDTPCHFSALTPRIVINNLGELSVWERPIEGRSYYMGVDVAEGIVTMTADGEQHQDWTVVTVMGEDGRTVAKHRSHRRPEDMWMTLIHIGMWYNNATINGELNNVGPLLWMCLQTGYPNLLVHPEPKNRPVRDRTWTRLTSTSRKLLIQNLRSLYRQDPSLVKSTTLYGEMVSFVIDKKGKPCAASGFHDDDIMSSAHADYARRIELGLIYEISPEPPEPDTTYKIRTPEEGCTILDTSAPWLASDME